MKPIILILIALTIGCGNKGSAPLNGVYTAQVGFEDVQICGSDIHLLNGSNEVYVCGGSPYSQTSNAGYVVASDGTFNMSTNGVSCSFQVQGGKLVDAPSPLPGQ